MPADLAGDEKYQRLLDEDLGRVRAQVRTAVPLREEERGMLSARGKLERMRRRLASG